MKNPCPDALRQSEHIDRTVNAGLCRLYRIVLIARRRSRAGQVVNLVDFKIERKRDVVANQLKIGGSKQVADIGFCTGVKIVSV